MSFLNNLKGPGGKSIDFAAAKSSVQKTLGIVPKSLAREVGFKRIEGTLDNSDYLTKEYGKRAVSKAINQEYLGSDASRLMRGARARASAASLLRGATKVVASNIGAPIVAGALGAAAIYSTAKKLGSEQDAAFKSQMKALDLDRQLKLKKQAAGKLRSALPATSK